MGARLLVLAAVVVFVCAVPAAGEWSHDATENNPVCVWAGSDKEDCIAVPDGEGGTYIVWMEDWTVDKNIHAQHMGADGTPLWTTNGIVVCDAADTQTHPAAVADHQGGVLIAWTDYRNGEADIYAQRLDGDGNALWGTDGRVVCDVVGTQHHPKIVYAGTGGAVIGWHDHRSGVLRMFLQRIAGGGSRVWSPAGVGAGGEAGVFGGPLELISDGEDGAFVGWYDSTSGKLWLQHVDSDGNVLWGADGYMLSDSNDCGGLSLVKDNDDGLFAAYHYDPLLLWGDNVVVKRVVGDTVLVWSRNLTPESGSDYSPQAVSDREGGVLVAWISATGDTIDLGAQRLDAGGNELWGEGGVPVCTYSGDNQGHQLITDGAGGAVIAWEDFRGYYRDIYAQRVDATGNVRWTSDGVLVGGASGVQEELSIASADDGAAVIAWSDYRSGDADIYAQRIERNGFLGDPAPAITDVADAPDDQGGEIVLGWSASYLDAWPEETIQRYSVWRRLNDGIRAGALPMPSSRELLEFGSDALERYGWTFVDNVVARYFDEYGYVVPSFGDSTESGVIWTDLMVLAEAEGLEEYWASGVVSAYSVDNVAPGAPVALEATELQVDVGLRWSPSGEFDEDLAHYNVYRSGESGFDVGEATLVDATSDTFYTDVDPGRSLWYYRVAAEDVHGNVGLASNEAYVETWTGTDMVPDRFSLRGCYPNPFNPVTTIAYDVPEPGGEVMLEIFDVRGRLVRTLVRGLETPGRKASVWDGSDETGASLSSGVYFCRMTAEDYEKTVKVTLLK